MRIETCGQVASIIVAEVGMFTPDSVRLAGHPVPKDSPTLGTPEFVNDITGVEVHSRV
jgi:hypothetical protein